MTMNQRDYPVTKPDSRQPLFSIITVTYNAADTIGATMRSISRQSFSDYEHLVIDGASTDDTLRIASSLADGQHCTIVSEPDKGLYDAMNKGIDRASGQYLIFLNAGDTFHSPSTLAIIAEAIRRSGNPGIVYGQTDVVDSSRKRLADRHLRAPEQLTLRSFANGMVVCHQAFIVLARIAPAFDTRYRYSADYDWCIRCLQHSRNNVYVPATLIDYLLEGISTVNRRKSLTERFRIMARYYGLVPTIMRHISFVPRFIRRRHLERRLTDKSSD